GGVTHTTDLEQRLRDCANGIGSFKDERGDYGICDTAADELARLRAENERLREALTPSGDTKAAYHGEFQFNIEYSDEDGDSYWQPHLVPWTTVKEVMAAIRARAALKGSSHE